MTPPSPTALAALVSALNEIYEAAHRRGANGSPDYEGIELMARAALDRVAVAAPSPEPRPMPERSIAPHYNQPNNVVACVACKGIVNVTALNAIRCEKCKRASSATPPEPRPTWTPSSLAAEMRHAVDSELPEDEPNDIRDWVYLACANVALRGAASSAIPSPTPELSEAGIEAAFVGSEHRAGHDMGTFTRRVDKRVLRAAISAYLRATPPAGAAPPETVT